MTTTNSRSVEDVAVVLAQFRIPTRGRIAA